MYIVSIAGCRNVASVAVFTMSPPPAARRSGIAARHVYTGPRKLVPTCSAIVFIREQLERARPIEASVVDQDVEFPVSSTDLLERGIDGVRIGDIGGDARYVTVELLGELVQPVGTSGQHEQRRALRGETPHDGLAGPTGAAGDDGDLAG